MNLVMMSGSGCLLVVRRIVVLALVCALALPAEAQQTFSGVVQGKGGVTVNDKPVTNSMAVGEGDTVATGADGNAVVSVRGSSVTLPPDSAARFSGNSIQLTQGKALVSTARKLSAKAGSNSVSLSASGRYDLSIVGDVLHIAATRGAVKVETGKAVITLIEGRMVAVPLNSAAQRRNCSPEEIKEQEEEVRRGAAIPASQLCQWDVVDTGRLGVPAPPPGSDLWVLLPVIGGAVVGQILTANPNASPRRP